MDITRCAKCGTEVMPFLKHECSDTGGYDPVNHPQHYMSHPSGIECIEITEHMGFNLGNAVKYLWRADLKGSALEDLKKACWYIEREIQKRETLALTLAQVLHTENASQLGQQEGSHG